MPAIPYRYRRCPSCKIILPAGRFPVLRFGGGWGKGTQARRCPSCGFKGASYTFTVVRERHGVDYGMLN